MKVSVGDFELNCEIEGKDGAPWVTFSHALGNNLSLWDDQVVLLKDDFRILRYDHRGHGGFHLTIDGGCLRVAGSFRHRQDRVGLSIGGMLGYGMAQNHGNEYAVPHRHRS